MIDPTTRKEWRKVALLARGALLFHSARAYGLIDGGPEINVERCEKLLAGARARGITVNADAAIAAFIVDQDLKITAGV